ncbi:cupin domain-containing protein [Pelomonas nitida]|uniref:Cupin domain-containing protein n=1 Tax=Pelomonas nitida TaxID=3299027 RepID=A0ABW7G3Q3_9BURK
MTPTDLPPFEGLQPHVHAHVRAAMTRAGLDAWIPEGVGKWSLPLQFLPMAEGGGWVELMRVAPGTRLTLHRHHGEVHGLNLQGSRRLDDGQLVQAGDYVFEPDGNVDSWEAVGDDVLVLHVVVRGDVDYVGADGRVQRRITTADRMADYRAFCAARGLQARLIGAAHCHQAGRLP